MVLLFIDEEARRKSMIRCPRFEDCESPLCPLDPYLKYKVSVPGRPLCWWYNLAIELENFADMPPCVVDKLPIYIVHLYQCGLLNPPGAKTTR